MPYGAATADRSQGSQVNSVVENESQKKYRRISDKSQDHQRFFKNLVEVPASQMNQHQSTKNNNNFQASQQANNTLISASASFSSTHQTTGQY